MVRHCCRNMQTAMERSDSDPGQKERRTAWSKGICAHGKQQTMADLIGNAVSLLTL